MTPAAPITVDVANGTLSNIVVKNAKGATVPGTFSSSAHSWQPTTALSGGAAYLVTASMTSADGKTTTATRSLTASKDQNLTNFISAQPSMAPQVGDGQPVVIEFSQPVTDKEAVQKAITVSDSKHVEGAFRWLTPQRLDYRPKTYWPVGDQISVKTNLVGKKIGSASYASQDYNFTSTVVSDLKAVDDLDKFTFTVTEHGKTIQTFKSDSGKLGLGSLTGTMVVLDKEQTVRMTSCSVGFGCNASSPNYYDELVHYATRITPTGMYVHAAPWDTQIGYVNSSHGCIHLSQADAIWFYNHAIPGNVVEVKGTHKNPISITNGDADWNLSWAQWTAPTS